MNPTPSTDDSMSRRDHCWLVWTHYVVTTPFQALDARHQCRNDAYATERAAVARRCSLSVWVHAGCRRMDEQNHSKLVK